MLRLVAVEMIKLPMYPAHPERVCWGCDKYCPAHDLACGNGSERTPHPQELFGDDWVEFAAERLGDSFELTPDDISKSYQGVSEANRTRATTASADVVV